LSEIVLRLGLPGLVLNGAKSGEEQTNENRDDCNNDEQLNERESASAVGVVCIGAGL